MVVQHNLTAMNSNRMLGVTTSAQAKSSEKLSSGYRINRAADDAAGLTISEKMRKQMRGLDRASTNAQDGVSAVQTAEGALTEVHSMLQRMNELANQASNGTNSTSDRDAIQAEIDQLTTEIDRVSETTKFNETYLLKGTPDGASSTVKVNAHDAGLAGKLVDSADGKSAKFTLNEKLENGSKISIAGTEYTIGEAKSKDNYSKKATVDVLVLNAGDSVIKSGVKTTLTDNVAAGNVTTAKIDGHTFEAGDKITSADGTVYEYRAAGGTNTAAGFYKVGDWADTTAAAAKVQTATSIAVSGATFTDKNGKAHAIVDDLADGEKSTLAFTDLKAATVAGGLAGGDSVEIGGKTTTVVGDNFTPTSFEDVKKGIQSSAAGKDVTISSVKGSGSKTYHIVENADEEDAAANKLTRENIIAKIKEGDQVTYTEKAATAETKVTAAGVDPLKEKTITKDEAYKKIAMELEKASSIGTDDGAGAKVLNKGDGSFEITKGSVSVKDALSFSLHVGADADMTNKINVDIESMSAAGLGVKGINVSDNNGAAATYAIDAIADAISKVSSQRSALGAVQNRLEHTISNLDNVVENTTAAESRIRDTDMAEEMVNYSKNNILAQAGQSMLAQANQSNQGVLSLLQ